MPTSSDGAPATAADSTTEFLTVEELAKRLKVDEKYVIWLCSRHGLPRVKVGGKPRFRPAEVNAWLEQRAVSPVKKAGQRGRP